MDSIIYFIKNMYSMSTEETGLWNLLLYLPLLIGAAYYGVILIRNIILRKVILRTLDKKINLDKRKKESITVYEKERSSNGYSNSNEGLSLRENILINEIGELLNIFNFTNHSLGKLVNQIIVTIIGYLLIFIGVTFLNVNINLLDLVGIFILIIGYQVFLWSIGVQSEFLGNKPNIEIKREGRLLH